MNRKLAVPALVYTGAALVQKGVGFLLFVYLAAVLSVEDYARFSLFYALQTAIVALATAGVIEAVIGRLKAEGSGADRLSLFGAANLLFVGLVALACVLFVLVLRFLMDATGASAGELLVVLGVGVVSGFYLFQSQLVRLDERHGASVILNCVPILTGYVAGIVGFQMTGTVLGFFAGSLLGLGLSLPLWHRSYSGLGYMRGEGARAKALVWALPPFVAIAAFAWISGYGSTYLINGFFDADSVARFTFAYTIASLLQLVATSLNQVWSPRFFRIAFEQSIAQVEARNLRFYLIQGIAIGTVGGALLALFPLAIHLAGERLAAYQGLSTGLLFLFIGYALSIPWYHAQNYFFVHARGREIMTVSISAGVFGLAVWLAAMWFLGPIGAFLGFAMQMGIRSVLVLVSARRFWPLSILWQGPLAAIVLMLAGALAGEWILAILPSP